ncbi:MAG: RNA polymerase sigma factor [Sedimentisphaerales bacterium]|nr:RNA polymerase sigma factor [Sedimentisphaerales bacterium]
MAESEELAQIIAGCKKSETDSFSQLIDMYSTRCYGYFYRLTGNRDVSDELLSRLFVKLVEKIHSFKGGSFEGWLFKVASNIFHDHLRDKQRQKKLLQTRKEQLREQVEQTKDSVDNRVDQLQIQLEKLDEDTRELIMLRFYSQLSFKEIARMRAEPIGTTLSKVHRALEKL